MTMLKYGETLADRYTALDTPWKSIKVAHGNKEHRTKILSLDFTENFCVKQCALQNSIRTPSIVVS